MTFGCGGVWSTVFRGGGRKGQPSFETRYDLCKT